MFICQAIAQKHPEKTVTETVAHSNGKIYLVEFQKGKYTSVLGEIVRTEHDWGGGKAPPGLREGEELLRTDYGTVFVYRKVGDKALKQEILDNANRKREELDRNAKKFEEYFRKIVPRKTNPKDVGKMA
jgi:hypothetical protein